MECGNVVAPRDVAALATRRWAGPGRRPAAGFCTPQGGAVLGPEWRDGSDRGAYAQGEATIQLTSSAHDVALSKVFDPPSLPM